MSRDKKKNVTFLNIIHNWIPLKAQNHDVWSVISLFFIENILQLIYRYIFWDVTMRKMKKRAPRTIIVVERQKKVNVDIKKKSNIELRKYPIQIWMWFETETVYIFFLGGTVQYKLFSNWEQLEFKPEELADIYQARQMMYIIYVSTDFLVCFVDCCNVIRT